MATVKSGIGTTSNPGFSDSDTITSTTLNNHVNDATVTNIANADVASNAAIAFTKLADITNNNLVGRVDNSANANVPIVIGGSGDAGVLFDNDDMLDNSNTAGGSAARGATQQSIKAYVDDSAYKESLLIFNGTTPIAIADKDTDANGTQCTLAFEHLKDSAQSDPDTAATDINDAGISLSSNEFTLSEGTYDITVNANVVCNDTTNTDPGLNVIAFIKRKSDNNKILISNVVRLADNVSAEAVLSLHLKGRIVIPNSPSANTNIYDLRFSADNANKAEIGCNSSFESLTPPPNHVTVSIVKIKA